MGGSGATNSINQNSQQQSQIAQQANQLSQQQYAQMQTEEAPAIGLYSKLTSGDPNAAMTAASPLLTPISQGYQASKDSIFNNVAPGAGRDAALANLNIQKNAATAGVFSNATAGAYDKLANIGAGAGAFSLNELGASLNAFSGSSAGYNMVAQNQAANKASTMGFLGQIVGGASKVGAAALGG